PAAPKTGSIKWTRSAQIENPTKSGGLDAVSCPLDKKTELCVVADEKGNVWISTKPTNTHAWHKETIDKIKGASLTGVSCPTASFCIVVDNQGYLSWTRHPGAGARFWTKPLHVDTTAPDGSTPGSDGYAGFAGISCPSASMCVAIDNAGQVVTSANPIGGLSAWSTTALAKTPVLSSISCPSTTLCVIGGSQRFYSTNPTGGTGNVISAITCQSITLCVGVGYGDGSLGLATATATPSGTASTWVNATVNAQIPSGNTQLLDAVGCPLSGLCIAADGADNVYETSTPLTGAWTAIKSPRKKSVSTWSSMSCDPKLCVLVDSRGWINTATVK
ncbi:MAG TPA: hypothetical protein VME01_09480, partial [Solirubrobacteraceae bacterium]|nr:hypothetical protein [Solirubrobacteraceae bacterium]